MFPFLPSPSAGETYAFAQGHGKGDSFAAESKAFVKDVAEKMAIEPVKEQARIPSLMSPAYNFFIDLLPQVFSEKAATRDGRARSQLRARRAFRGIVSVLALRDLLGLKASMVTFNPTDRADGGLAGGEHDYRSVYSNAYGVSPKFGDNDSGVWRHFRYLVVEGMSAAGQKTRGAICGISPYSLFFPAASSLTVCSPVFWYLEPAEARGRIRARSKGEWFDPTTDFEEYDPIDFNGVKIDRDVILEIRGCMIAWLDAVLQSNPLEALLAFGLHRTSAEALIETELKAWLTQISALDHTIPEVKLSLKEESIGLTSGLNLRNQTALPILEQKLVVETNSGDGAHVPRAQRSRFKKGRLPGLVCELPRHRGRILISRELLANTERRVCGSLMGGTLFDGIAERLPMEGNRLELKVGAETFVIEEPYLNVDKLFLDEIHRLADRDLSAWFFGLRDEERSEYWFYPFKKDIFRYVDYSSLSGEGDERKSVVSCKFLGEGRKKLVRVTVEIGGVEFSKDYPEERRNWDAAGDLMDIRVWPNLRFSVEPRLPANEADRVHYFRLRRQEEWNISLKSIEVLGKKLTPSGNPTDLSEIEGFEAEDRDAKWPNDLGSDPYCDGLLFSFAARQNNDDFEPVGIGIQGRGLCMIRLSSGTARKKDAILVNLAVDFGTSHTCVAVRPLSEGQQSEATPLQFEMMTASLHKFPHYPPLGHSRDHEPETEGASSVLDFPFLYGPEKFLCEGQFFPSLFATKHIGITLPADSFKISSGLVFPRNLMEKQDILQLLHGYPPSENPDYRPFHILSGIKLEHIGFRKAFLWHLHKMIVFQTAKRGEVVRSAAFSFPRAFSRDDVHKFEAELVSVFGGKGEIPHDKIITKTESDAVQQWMMATAPDSQPLVIDAGGGTIDILGLFKGHHFQASYRLAAGSVNKYFSASPVLANLFLDAIEYNVAGSDRERSEEQKSQLILVRRLIDATKTLKLDDEENARYLQQAFFRMLGMLNDDDYPSIVGYLHGRGTKEPLTKEQKSVVKGFFSTLVLLWCGVVFQAGRIMRQLKVETPSVDLQLIGNGSNFYRMLNFRRMDFSKVLAKVFQDALGNQPTVDCELKRDGKSLVAKGLLCPELSEKAKSRVVSDRESQARLLQMETGNVNPPSEPDFPDIKQFLEVLNKHLPHGQFEDGSTVIPFCDVEGGPDLFGDIDDVYRRMIVEVHSTELENAKTLRKDIERAFSDLGRVGLGPGGQEGAIDSILDMLDGSSSGEVRAFVDSANGCEPSFVTRLRVLIDRIRQKYAK